MTIDEIEDLAFNGAPLPEHLNEPNTLLFLMFRNLYDYAKRSQMPREQGKREKQRILKLYENALYKDKLSYHHVKVIKDTESALETYFKAPSIENADKLAEAFEGVLLRKEVTRA